MTLFIFHRLILNFFRLTLSLVSRSEDVRKKSTVVFGKFCFNFKNENPGCFFMTLSVTLGSIELRTELVRAFGIVTGLREFILLRSKLKYSPQR